MRHALPLRVLIAVCTIAVATACQQDDTPASAGKLTFQLKWTPSGQFVGFYAAKALNYYAEEGLDVTFLHGGPDVNTIAQVANGVAHVGLATGDQVLTWSAAASGDRVALRALGTVFDSSLARFMSHADAPIRTPQDLAGKRVGVFPNQDTDNLLRVLLQRHGIAPSALTIVDFPSLSQFDQGALHAYPAYVINEPVLQRLRGNNVHLLDPADFGASFYSDTIITTEAYHRDHRDTLVRFLRASIRGWQLAESNFDRAAAAMAKEIQSAIGSGEPWQHQEATAREAAAYLRRDAGQPVFAMDAARWQQMQQALAEIGRMPRTIEIAALCDFAIASEAEPR